ncbi:MAG: metal-dependent transcriptional regulator [Planctomycetales bacterium]|nr:metal-dependent transcriptional regulator [Planctomycetales bacterium]
MVSKTDEMLSASLEDYLEAIYNLSRERNVARSKDIAHLLDVTRASVTGALKTLSEKELIHYQPYGYVVLTEKGRHIAGRIAGRHEILKQFFEDVLGTEGPTAQEAACRAEHTLGTEITARLTAFIEFVTQARGDGQDIAHQFRRYWDTFNDT